MNTPELNIFDTPAAAVAWLVQYFRWVHGSADRPATYLVPGGSTPRPFFEGIAALDLNWHQTAFYPTDERVVPLDSDQSNYRLLRNTLGDTGADIQSLYHPRTGPEGSVRFLNDRPFPPVRLAVLGLGDDGHTASLFPGQAANLSETGNAFLTRNPHDGTPRISLTYSLLARAEEIVFLFFGTQKQPALQRLLAADYQPLSYPAQYFPHHYRRKLTVVTDVAAADRPANA